MPHIPLRPQSTRLPPRAAPPPLQSATARARKQAELAKASKGSQLKVNAACMSILCNVCRQQFMNTTQTKVLTDHAESRHPKQTFQQCFPDHVAS